MSAYLDSKDGTFWNAAHWMSDPIDADSLAVLRRLSAGTRPRPRERLDVPRRTRVPARGLRHLDVSGYGQGRGRPLFLRERHVRDIPTVAKYIDALAAANRLAEQQLASAVGSLGMYHGHLVTAAEHVAHLTEGASSGALVDLAEHTHVARQIVAEAILALSRLRPSLRLDDKDRSAIIADARAGMAAKLLAKWEADALREAAVEVLAGTEPAL